MTVTVHATVVDTFTATNTSVAIKTTITTDNPKVEFTAALRTPLQWTVGTTAASTSPPPPNPGPSAAATAAAALSTVWMPWGKGCVQNDGRHAGMCFTDGGPWENPFQPEALSDRPGFYRYGGSGRGTNDTFSLPMASVLDPSSDAGRSEIPLSNRESARGH